MSLAPPLAGAHAVPRREKAGKLRFVPAGATTDVPAAGVPATPASILTMFTARPIGSRPVYISKTQNLELSGVP